MQRSKASRWRGSQAIVRQKDTRARLYIVWKAMRFLCIGSARPQASVESWILGLHLNKQSNAQTDDKGIVICWLKCTNLIIVLRGWMIQLRVCAESRGFDWRWEFGYPGARFFHIMITNTETIVQLSNSTLSFWYMMAPNSTVFVNLSNDDVIDKIQAVVTHCFSQLLTLKIMCNYSTTASRYNTIHNYIQELVQFVSLNVHEEG